MSYIALSQFIRHFDAWRALRLGAVISFGVTIGIAAETAANSADSSASVTRPAITNVATAAGRVHEQFSLRIIASGSPAAFSASDLPPGLSIHCVTGEIRGIPLVAGTSTIHVTAENSAGSHSVAIAVTIAPEKAGG